MRATGTTILAIATLALVSPSRATESTDKALHTGSNPLKAAMGKPIYANRVFQHGYHCWDPSLIKVGDTYHLIYSRWKMVPGEVNNLGPWMDNSEIVHATSKNLLGQGVVEQPRLAQPTPRRFRRVTPRCTTAWNALMYT